MDGYFLELEAEKIENEVDEFAREIFKLQKIFTRDFKKKEQEQDERRRDRAKARQKALVMAEGQPIPEEEEEEDVKPPEALHLCNQNISDIKKFKVRENTSFRPFSL